MTQPNFASFERLKMNAKRFLKEQFAKQFTKNYTKFVTILYHNWNKILPNMANVPKGVP
jgi:hypothetical protein